MLIAPYTQLTYFVSRGKWMRNTTKTENKLVKTSNGKKDIYTYINGHTEVVLIYLKNMNAAGHQQFTSFKKAYNSLGRNFG